MRIGSTGIVVDDQDQAEKFSTQVLGFQVKTSAPAASPRPAAPRLRLQARLVPAILQEPGFLPELHPPSPGSSAAD